MTDVAAVNEKPPNTSSVWNDALVERLRSLLAARYSASQIARELGVTRNMVVGKAHRLGLRPNSNHPNRRKPAGRRRDVTSAPRKRSSGVFLTRLNTPKTSISLPAYKSTAPSLEIPILELRYGQCRYETTGVDAPQDFLFCGHKTVPGTSWCPYHHHRVTLR